MESQIWSGRSPSPELWQHARSQARSSTELGQPTAGLSSSSSFLLQQQDEAGKIPRQVLKVHVIRGWVKAAGCTLKRESPEGQRGGSRKGPLAQQQAEGILESE